MAYNNALQPTPKQIEETFLSKEDGPSYMVNLLKFKKRAEYTDGRETSLAGREAYALYGQGVVETLTDVGGSIVFGAEVVGLLVGQVDELWDDVAIAMYPNGAAMAQMVSSPKYQAIHVHREAGLAGQLNITTRVRGALAGASSGG